MRAVAAAPPQPTAEKQPPISSSWRPASKLRRHSCQRCSSDSSSCRSWSRDSSGRKKERAKKLGETLAKCTEVLAAIALTPGVLQLASALVLAAVAGPQMHFCCGTACLRRLLHTLLRQKLAQHRPRWRACGRMLGTSCSRTSAASPTRCSSPAWTASCPHGTTLRCVCNSLAVNGPLVVTCELFSAHACCRLAVFRHAWTQCCAILSSS